MIITKKKYDQVEARNVELARNLKDACDANKELKQLRLQEVHNNTGLINKNRELQNYKDEVENIVNGLRTPEEKIEKIKELIHKYQLKN